MTKFQTYTYDLTNIPTIYCEVDRETAIASGIVGDLGTCELIGLSVAKEHQRPEVIVYSPVRNLYLTLESRAVKFHPSSIATEGTLQAMRMLTNLLHSLKLCLAVGIVTIEAADNALEQLERDSYETTGLLRRLCSLLTATNEELASEGSLPDFPSVKAETLSEIARRIIQEKTKLAPPGESFTVYGVDENGVSTINTSASPSDLHDLIASALGLKR